MNKILLLTTKGCLGCEIVDKNIQFALDDTSKQIVYDKQDVTTIEKSFLKKNNIKDFPCILFIKDDNVVFNKVGSCPRIFINRWIDIYFK